MKLDIMKILIFKLHYQRPQDTNQLVYLIFFEPSS